ncbi:MAG: sulfatase, partial [Planctomycetaceae bacterium]|nr:sulfatase [Planctomycetaceae bacterium]
LLDALADPSPSVRIAASRALLKIEEPQRALATLKNELAGAHEWARLRAAIVLDEAGEAARPLIPELQRCLTDQPNKYITRVANRTLNVLLNTNNVVK